MPASKKKASGRREEGPHQGAQGSDSWACLQIPPGSGENEAQSTSTFTRVEEGEP